MNEGLEDPRMARVRYSPLGIKPGGSCPVRDNAQPLQILGSGQDRHADSEKQKTEISRASPEVRGAKSGSAWTGEG